MNFEASLAALEEQLAIAAKEAKAIVAQKTGCLLLQRPTPDSLRASLEKIRGFYSRAYNWPASQLEVGQVTSSMTMRKYIKSWITTWDHERIFGMRPDIETIEVLTDYEEIPDLETPAEAEEDNFDRTSSLSS
jgi:hypothetical protein